MSKANIPILLTSNENKMNKKWEKKLVYKEH